MGTDKALVHLGERSLLERAVATLAERSGWVGLACGARPRYADLGLPLLLDEEEGQGPLAGLRAALGGTPAELVLVMACDLPWATPAMLDALLARTREAGLDACLYERDGRPEPLCAVYRRGCLSAIDAALAAGERKATSFWSYPGPDGGPLRVERLSADEAARHGLANVNTPEDLERARADQKRREESR